MSIVNEWCKFPTTLWQLKVGKLWKEQALRNYLLWRRVDCPLRNVRSVCSLFSALHHPPPFSLSLSHTHTHTHTHKTGYSEKGEARWFWGLAMRKGPSFTSRLLLNSSADWQEYKIWAIWELFGSLGPVPNEQVLTWKRLPGHWRCRHGALWLPSGGGGPNPPSNLLPLQKPPHSTL